MTNKRIRKKQGMMIRMAVCMMFFVFILNFIFPEVCFAASKEQILYEGPVAERTEDLAEPELYLEQNGKVYQLLSSEIKDVKVPGILTYISTRIPYELEGMQEPPEAAVVTVHDEATGELFEREVPQREILEQGSGWSNEFYFPVTVYGYGAELFYLGEHEIPGDTDLSEYRDLLLEYLSLPQDCYRIDTVEWVSEPYEEEGMICRDAVAFGEKRIRYVEVVYGGQVRTPDSQAKQYVAVYEEIIRETEPETPVPVTLPAEEQEFHPEAAETGLGERIMRWVKEHLTVVVFSSAFLALCLGWLFLICISNKKKEEEIE